MAKTIVIGVTGPLRGIPWAWWATRWHLHRLRDVTPLRLTSRDGILHERVAGVIVGGGNDIDPAIYGGDVSASPSLDPERDRYELEVLKEADRRKIPVLGICRGAQLLNVHAGGTLIGDLKPHRKFTSNKATLLPRKVVAIAADSTLAQWLDSSSIKVNSLHHQAVKDTGDNLRVCARDRDGIVQAIENCSGVLRIGFQWHPEYMPQQRAQRTLFERFATACRDA